MKFNKIYKVTRIDEKKLKS